MKCYTFKAVSCSRKGSYDAEIAFTIEEGLDTRSTVQKLMGTG